MSVSALWATATRPGTSEPIDRGFGTTQELWSLALKIGDGYTYSSPSAYTTSRSPEHSNPLSLTNGLEYTSSPSAYTAPPFATDPQWPGFGGPKIFASLDQCSMKIGDGYNYSSPSAYITSRSPEHSSSPTASSIPHPHLPTPLPPLQLTMARARRPEEDLCFARSALLDYFGLP
ncbi:hypothetical protein ONZ45_g13415 [Pleurotus djamor]|nr:hypothetical protein ONZ45_g13415 [Pleurotus djamor]